MKVQNTHTYTYTCTQIKISIRHFGQLKISSQLKLINALLVFNKEKEAEGTRQKGILFVVYIPINFKNFLCQKCELFLVV